MPDPSEMMGGAPPPSAPGGGQMPPGGMPQSAAGGAPSPATSPVANEGIKAAARSRVANMVSLLHMAAIAFGAGSEEAEHINKAIGALTKIASPRDMSAGLMSADLQKLQMQHRQQAQNATAMRGSMQQQPQQAQPGMAA